MSRDGGRQPTLVETQPKEDVASWTCGRCERHKEIDRRRIPPILERAENNELDDVLCVGRQARLIDRNASGVRGADGGIAVEIEPAKHPGHGLRGRDCDEEVEAISALGSLRVPRRRHGSRGPISALQAAVLMEETESSSGSKHQAQLMAVIARP